MFTYRVDTKVETQQGDILISHFFISEEHEIEFYSDNSNQIIEAVQTYSYDDSTCYLGAALRFCEVVPVREIRWEINGNNY